jgi:AcrR family transcriptional regulator
MPQIEGAAERSRQEEKAAAARERIISAVIDCLDGFGYAETSINRIQQVSGMSRGALTHHFPSKEALMVETAERLLGPTLLVPPRGRGASGNNGLRPCDVEADILWIWHRLVDTREGRALLELLVAARTDAILRGRIAATFLSWNDAINSSLVDRYRGLGLEAEQLQDLWTICRVFLRGLNTQNQFENDPKRREALVRRFARMVTSQLCEAGEPRGGTPESMGTKGTTEP